MFGAKLCLLAPVQTKPIVSRGDPTQISSSIFRCCGFLPSPPIVPQRCPAFPPAVVLSVDCSAKRSIGSLISGASDSALLQFLVVRAVSRLALRSSQAALTLHSSSPLSSPPSLLLRSRCRSCGRSRLVVPLPLVRSSPSRRDRSDSHKRSNNSNTAYRDRRPHRGIDSACHRADTRHDRRRWTAEVQHGNRRWPMCNSGSRCRHPRCSQLGAPQTPSLCWADSWRDG